MSLMKQPTKRTWAAKARKPRRRWGGRRRGAAVALPKRVTGNFASATETFSLAATAGITYDFLFNMNDLVRTKALMSVYQYYRITSVELRFKPYFDTYNNGLAGGQTLPYLYFQYDKSGALQGMNAAQFEEIGTKAIRLDDKTLVRKWKPSVVTDTGIGGVTQFKVSPWIPTFDGNATNDQVDHYGCVFYISKMSPSDATAYDVDVVVNVQYRKPFIQVSNNVSVNPPRVKQTNETMVTVPPTV